MTITIVGPFVYHIVNIAVEQQLFCVWCGGLSATLHRGFFLRRYVLWAFGGAPGRRYTSFTAKIMDVILQMNCRWG